MHLNSTQECHTLSQKNPERTNTYSRAPSYSQRLCTTRDLRPNASCIVIDLLGVTNLLCMSPNKLGMPVYLVNRIAFPPLTSNNTKCCTHLMFPSDQLSSPMDSSLSHLQHQQVTTMSLFQLCWVYKQATLDPVHSVSPLLLP